MPKVESEQDIRFVMERAQALRTDMYVPSLLPFLVLTRVLAQLTLTFPRMKHHSLIPHHFRRERSKSAQHASHHRGCARFLRKQHQRTCRGGRERNLVRQVIEWPPSCFFRPLLVAR